MAIKKYMKKKGETKKLYKKKGNRAWYDKKYSVAEVARHAWSGVKFIKGLINVEKQFIVYNNAYSPATPGTTAQVIPLNVLDQGLDDTQRKGDSILMKHLQLKLHINGNTNSASDRMRAILFCDKENRGATPAATDLLVTADTISNTNLDNLDRFIIMRDETYTITPGAGYWLTDKWFQTLDVHAKYAGTGSGASNLRQNSLFLLLVGVDNTNKASVLVDSRIAFYDN